MARRPSELSIRPVPVAPRRPPVPGREGQQPSVLTPEKIPLPQEQDEALLARFEALRAQVNVSLPEFIVWEFLTITKRQRPEVDFNFQASFLGGRTQFGGVVADFYFDRRREVWQVQGLRYHLQNAADRAKTEIANLMYRARGLQVIELWEDDLLQRPTFVLNLAWDRGVGVKRAGR